MRCIPRWAVTGLLILAMANALSRSTAQAPDTFRWINFQSASDQDVVVWVTRALDGQKWSAIREIGVQYDAALVVTTYRSSPQASPNRDTFTIWSVSLADRKLTRIADGTNLRLTDWLLLDVGQGRELGALYDDCNDCAATTYFTVFHYDLRQHIWNGRWMQNGKAVAVWTANSPLGATQSQVYAVLADDNGHEILGAWNHIDYGKTKPAEDSIYRYDVDSTTDIERNQLLSGHDAATMKDRLCHAQNAVPGLYRGQDSTLCQTTPPKPHYERKPVTTPPPHNQGQSRPPGTRQ
jgi:hypothetical protein